MVSRASNTFTFSVGCVSDICPLLYVVFSGVSDVTVGPVPCNNFNMASPTGVEPVENTVQRTSDVDSMSARDDVSRRRGPGQRLISNSSGLGSSDWFERTEARQRSTTGEYLRGGDERCFVRYLPPAYSQAVQSRSGRCLDQVTTACRYDCQSASGHRRTVDL